MADQQVKRSRFDQAEPESERRSRFDDRRSRSPASRGNESRRSRSPVKSTDADEEARKSAAQAAAQAAASRINASLNQRKSMQQSNDSTPVNHSATPTPAQPKAASPSDPVAGFALEEEVYQQDGDFIKDIEINDLRNRYTMTKGPTQKMIKDETGADVTTRGSFLPDKALATLANPPLYLHVTSTTREGLELAVKKIYELMKQDLPNLVDERRFRRRDQPERTDVDSMGRRKWPEERIPVDLEPIPGFNLRAQVVGTGGSNVKHIQQVTRCRVQIKGRGSGYMESDTGMESDEQMFLYVTGPVPDELAEAKKLCESLLEAVRESYEAFKARGPPQRGGHHGGGGGGYNEDRGHHRGERHHGGSYGGGHGGNSAYGGGYGNNYGNNSYGGAGSPPVATPETADTADPQRQYEAWAAYYAQNPQLDPYAAYGGFAALMSQYQQGQQLNPQGGPQTQYGGPTEAVAGMNAPPPPPPPDADGPPPPPPPPGAPNGSGGFNAVPPPPGM